ncbi:MAG: hypothetical protein WC121_00605 [Candidatus Kapaibacterium sp.]
MSNYKFKQRILNLPSNPQLKQRARELHKQGILSEVLLLESSKEKANIRFGFR